MRFATAVRISSSGRASPGGSAALRTRCTRRSPLTNVTSLSAPLAHAVCARREDLLVGTRFAGGFGGLAHPLHPAFTVDERAVALRPARRGGQHHVRETPRLGQEYVLYDEEVQV